MASSDTRAARDRQVVRIRRILVAAVVLLAVAAGLLGGARQAIARPAPDEAAAPAAARVPGQEARVEIPSLRISLPVVRGGQEVIDRGVAAHYAAAGWRAPTEPGRSGTYWLAAHDSAGVFGRLPEITEGAEVRVVADRGTVYTYRVTSLATVGETATDADVYGNDASAARILLQTCVGPDRRLLVHGDLVSSRAA
jgi:LPXTG-site transpeptidase (sortase) family protein